MLPRETLCAVDPGATTGIAIFEDGVLLAATAERQRAHVGSLRWRVVIEVPDRVEPGIPLKDILLNARRAGELGGRALERGARVEYIEASSWKGSVPWKIHNSRVLALLSDAERARLPSRDHNMIDAVGLGLWALGRMTRGR